MPEWIDALSDHGRIQWFIRMKALGMAPKPKKTKPVEVSGRIEPLEEIDQLMRQQPGSDHASSDTE